MGKEGGEEARQEVSGFTQYGWFDSSSWFFFFFCRTLLVCGRCRLFISSSLFCPYRITCSLTHLFLSLSLPAGLFVFDILPSFFQKRGRQKRGRKANGTRARLPFLLFVSLFVGFLLDFIRRFDTLSAAAAAAAACFWWLVGFFFFIRRSPLRVLLIHTAHPPSLSLVPSLSVSQNQKKEEEDVFYPCINCSLHTTHSLPPTHLPLFVLSLPPILPLTFI